jgi:hypothetical protein
VEISTREEREGEDEVRQCRGGLLASRRAGLKILIVSETNTNKSYEMHFHRLPG